jgi:hypothetical protein
MGGREDYGAVEEKIDTVKTVKAGTGSRHIYSTK